MIAATSGCVAGHLEPAGPPGGVRGRTGWSWGRSRRSARATDGRAAGRVTGRWPYASMCESASWIMAGTVRRGGERRLMFAPAEELTVPTWQVLGLCATGSHDVELPRSVAAEYSVPLSFDRPRQDGPLYAFPVFGLLAAGIATVSLGIAEGAIGYLGELANAKTPTYSVRKLAERPAVQRAVAQCGAQLRATRGLLAEAVEQAWTQACERRAVDLDARLAIRVAAVEATSAAVAR